MNLRLSTAGRPRIVTTILCTLALGAGVLAGPSPAASASTAGTRSGVFEGGAAAAKVRQFEAWRGSQVGVVSAFVPGATWSDIAVPSWYTRHWGGSEFRDRMLVTLPMLPSSDPRASLSAGARGHYNRHFEQAARNLVAAGMGNARIRVGHELNGSWYRWSAAKSPSSYAAYYRNIVRTMRSVPGQAFTFEWNVSVGVTGFDATRAYPGDAYVDYIGQDVYDVKWGDPKSTPESRWRHKVRPVYGTYRHGLQFWADFASARGKKLAFSEWGLTDKYAPMAKGGGGGDSPYFIERMRQWFADHPTAYEIYFNEDAKDGRHDLANPEFAEAAGRYRALF